MSSIDPEMKNRLESQRKEYAEKALDKAGIIATFMPKEKCFEFVFNGQKVRHFPYTGWFTGKSVVDGRGIHNLLKQIKNKKETT